MGELGLTQQSQSETESFHFFHLLFFTLTKYQISSYEITPSETWANGLSVGILLNIKLFELFKLLYKKTTFIIHNGTFYILLDRTGQKQWGKMVLKP